MHDPDIDADAQATNETPDDTRTHRGTITREFTVWCGTCSNWDQEGDFVTLPDARRAFQGRGWRHTKTNGWQCPVCRSRRIV